MGGKNNKQEIPVAEYRLSMHVGICLGPARIRKLWIGEKIAWQGDESTYTGIVTYKPDFFGGPEKEGGIEGTAFFLPGDESQTMPEHLAERLGRTEENCPAFRGISSLFFTGDVIASIPNPLPNFGGWFGTPEEYSREIIYTGRAGYKGFVWGAQNPYLKTAWATVTDEPFVDELNDSIAMIGDDANPAHIIFACLTDDEWGMGAAATLIDVTSFASAAQTLYDESFGLSLGWFQQETIESFIAELLDHIQATVYVNPATGLFTIKLLRDDYDSDTLPVFDERNSRLTEFQRKGWGETVNEIVVTYTDPSNEEEATVSVHELSNIMQQGERVSDSRDYFGVRNPDLALQLATRDVRTASAPLATAKMVTNRIGWDLVPGDVVKVSNQTLNLTETIFRITSINYGKTNSGEITVDLLEDIFGFRTASYFSPPTTLHPGEDADPEELDYTLTFTLPAFFIANQTGAFPDEGNYYSALLGADQNSNTLRFELQHETTDVQGTEEFESLGTRPLTSRGTLDSDVTAEAQSTIDFGTYTKGTGPAVNGFVYFKGDTEEESEIAFIQDLDSNLDFIVDRGMLDTIPREWPAGTPIWFINLTVPFGDSTARAEAEEVIYKALTQTARGTLEVADASEISHTVDPRSDRPIRPANVQVNGQGFGEVDAVDEDTITVSWSNRDKLVEETRVYTWTEAGHTLPAGQRTYVRLYNPDGTLIAEDSGLTGESFVLNPYDYAGKNLVIVEVGSHIEDSNSDGLESFQAYQISVRVGYGGWGLNWDYSWGGGA